MKTTLKILIFFFILISSCSATNLEISYFYDKNNTIELKDVIKKNFTTISTKHSFNPKSKTVWYKLEIRKSSNLIDKEKNFIHNNMAYLSKHVDIYEKIDKNFKHTSYNLMDKNIGNKLSGKTLIYPIEIELNKTKTIYIKNQALIQQLINIEIFNNKQSTNSLINKNFFSNIIVFILITLGLYNLMLFLFTKRKEFLFYTLYMINCAIGLFYMYGSIFQNFNIYGEDTYKFNITAIFVVLFLALFIRSIFDINKKSRNNYLAINSLLIVDLFFIFYAFVNLYEAIKLIQFLYFYSFAIIFYIGYNLFKQNHPLIKLFIVAYFIYFIGFGITVSSISGSMELNSFTFYGSGIALILEGFIFAYMLSYRLKLLENQVAKQEKTLILKNKKEQLGEVIGNIAHQWRQPLNRINLNVAVVTDIVNDENNQVDKEVIKKKLTSIESNIVYMSNTIEDFVDFYNPDKEFMNFNLFKIVEDATNLLKSKINTTKINISIDKDIKLYGIENEYLQVLLIILNNALDNFQIKETIDPMINITLQNDSNTLTLIIQDNGGGILKENIEKVFDPYFTTKFKKEGSGLGLYLAKTIIEESMYGKLAVEVVNNHTKFLITLNKKKF